MNIYVGNLSFDSSEQSVRALFEQHGAVSSVNPVGYGKDPIRNKLAI